MRFINAIFVVTIFLGDATLLQFGFDKFHQCKYLRMFLKCTSQNFNIPSTAGGQPVHMLF